MEKNKMILDLVQKNNLRKLTKSDIELLELFSYFVYSSRPEYKYNETYLKDYISEFNFQLDTLERKRKIANTILKKINSIKKSSNTNIEIVLDNIYLIKSGEQEVIVVEEQEIKKLFNIISFVNILVDGLNGKILRTEQYDLSDKKNINELYIKVEQYVRKSEDK